MKKIITLLLTLLIGFSLAGCVVEEPNDDQNVNDPSTDDPNDPVDQRDAAPTSITNLIESSIGDYEYFFILNDSVSNTNITNVYSVEDESEHILFTVFRLQYMGRWDTVDFLLIIDETLQVIDSVVIVSHGENWGAFIELDSFLNQFDGQPVNYYLSNDIVLGVDGNASATTTINGFNQSLEDALNYYQTSNE